MLRDNLVELIEPMLNSAGADPLAVYIHTRTPASDDRLPCLKNPRPEGAESSLTESASSPFQAEPAQNEVRILVHLAGKVDKSKLDYRPTPKQRSTLELLQYMAIMGPTQVAVIKAGAFDRAALSAAWSPAEAAAKR